MDAIDYSKKLRRGFTWNKKSWNETGGEWTQVRVEGTMGGWKRNWVMSHSRFETSYNMINILCHGEKNSNYILLKVEQFSIETPAQCVLLLKEINGVGKVLIYTYQFKAQLICVLEDKSSRLGNLVIKV